MESHLTVKGFVWNKFWLEMLMVHCQLETVVCQHETDTHHIIIPRVSCTECCGSEMRLSLITCEM